MTREKAIKKLNWALDNNMIEDIQSAYDYIMAIKLAIKALEQEPTNKIVQKAYEDGKKDGYVQAKVEQESCDDCISRRAACDITICDGISCNECPFNFNTCEDGQNRCLLEERISKLPSVTPQPKTGYWIPLGKYDDYGDESCYKCSECGDITSYPDKYCGSCGIKMQEVRKKDDG